MFPHIQIFLKQTQRGTKRLVLQLVLLCAAVAFFVVSLNLYSNSRQNLLTVENIYSTIATMEIYGDVDAQGNLVHPSDEACVGRYWLSVNDYDLSPFRALSYVKDVELRTRVAAYIPGEVKVVREMGEDPILPPDYKELGNTRNTIRFVLDSEDPVTYSLRGGGNIIISPSEFWSSRTRSWYIPLIIT